MKSNVLVRMLSILAIADTLALVLVIIGAGECTRGDGCLLFSLLLLIALAAGALILLLSLVTWGVGRKSWTIPKYFMVSNVILLIVASMTVSATMLFVR